PLLAWPVERRERPRAPLQAPPALRDQLCTPIGRDALRQAHRLLVVMGRVHTPTSSPHRRCHGGLIHPGLALHTPRAESPRRPLTVAAFGRCLHGGVDAAG